MEDEHYAHCDGLCHDCPEFTWCELSPAVKTEEVSEIPDISKTITNPQEI